MPDRIHVHARRGPALALFAVAAVAAASVAAAHGLTWGLYGAAVAVLLGGKLALSLAPARRYPAEPPPLRTCVVVPVYNEDPGILARALASIDAQDVPPTHVVIIDDGSPDPAAYQAALDWASTRTNVVVVLRPGNHGKREALAKAFRMLAGQVDVWVCVDSDTVLDPAAIAEGLRPFHDPDVTAVTGTVLALNPHRGLLPRLVDLRYVNAFLYERAAYSRLGAVLCCCGSLAFYRADVVAEHLDDFLGQTFLGQPAVFGDDRRMTNYALLHGRVELARTAVARTAVPERLGHFLRQQVRWGKSFFRESLWVLRTMPVRSWAWWLTLLELGSWGGFTVGMAAAVYVHPAVHGVVSVVDYALWVCLAGWARSVHVFSVDRPDWPRRQQLLTFALAPLYGGVHLAVLLPLRLWSLATLRTGTWGTRKGGAEVRDEP